MLFIIILFLFRQWRKYIVIISLCTVNFIMVPISACIVIKEEYSHRAHWNLELPGSLEERNKLQGDAEGMNCHLAEDCGLEYLWGPYAVCGAGNVKFHSIQRRRKVTTAVSYYVIIVSVFDLERFGFADLLSRINFKFQVWPHVSMLLKMMGISIQFGLLTIWRTFF